MLWCVIEIRHILFYTKYDYLKEQGYYSFENKYFSVKYDAWVLLVYAMTHVEFGYFQNLITYIFQISYNVFSCNITIHVTKEMKCIGYKLSFWNHYNLED